MSPSPCIRELSIEGFKSYGTPGQTISLGPLNFVVGANASGKTNLLWALRFLRDAVLNDVEFAASELGSIADTVHRADLDQKRARKPRLIRIGMVMDRVPFAIEVTKARWEIEHFQYDVLLSAPRSNERLMVTSEELLVSLRDPGGTSQEYRLERNASEVIIRDPTREKEPELRVPVPKQEKSRLAVSGVGFFSYPATVLRELIGSWHFYNLSPRVARLPSEEPRDIDLGPAGENLAVILHRLGQEDSGRFMDAVTTTLRNVIPGFKGIKTRRLPIEGKWAFEVEEENVRDAISPDSASDGTIRLLLLAVIAQLTNRDASLIGLEEPENGIHPHLYEHVVEILRAASGNVQFIITTHNPAFLDYLAPEELILCDKVDGKTRLMHASDIAQLDVFRRQFSLGELWTQGVLGGVP